MGDAFRFNMGGKSGQIISYITGFKIETFMITDENLFEFSGVGWKPFLVKRDHDIGFSDPVNTDSVVFVV